MEKWDVKLIDEIWKRNTIKIRIDNQVNFRERFSGDFFVLMLILHNNRIFCGKEFVSFLTWWNLDTVKCIKTVVPLNYFTPLFEK